jgi:predicted DNA-binding protein
MEHTAPMKRTQIFLSPSQREKLARRSERTGAPRAEIIRRAIDQYLGDAETDPRAIDELGDAQSNRRGTEEYLGAAPRPSIRRKR